jgi:hypothetical protein
VNAFTDPAVIALTVAYLGAAGVFVALVARAPRPRFKVEQARPITRVTVHTDAPLQAGDLEAISHLLAAHFDNPDAVYDAIVAQVAADEAAEGLDAALDRITEDGAA